MLKSFQIWFKHICKEHLFKSIKTINYEYIRMIFVDCFINLVVYVLTDEPTDQGEQRSHLV